MLKRTVKISLCLLLHVSFQLDQPQGALASFSKAQHTLPEDGPIGPKHVGANIRTF